MGCVKHLQAPARSIYVSYSTEQDFHRSIYVAILSDELLCKEQNGNMDGRSVFLPGWPQQMGYSGTPVTQKTMKWHKSESLVQNLYFGGLLTAVLTVRVLIRTLPNWRQAGAENSFQRYF